MKKICFLGDSITEGAIVGSMDKRYSTLCAKLLGAEELNFGVGGTRFAKQTVTHCSEIFNEQFIARAKKMPEDADLVVVLGATNDWGHGDAPIGNKVDRTSDTFWGATYELVDYLTKKYSSKKLLFILPLPRWNENDPYGELHCKKTPSTTLEEYRTILKTVLNEYGVRYTDFSKELPASEKCEGGLIHADFVHPNELGHKILAESLAKYIKDNKLL